MNNDQLEQKGIEDDNSYIGFSNPDSKYISAKVMEQEELLPTSEDEIKNKSNTSFPKLLSLSSSNQEYRFTRLVKSKLIFRLISCVIIITMFLSLFLESSRGDYEYKSSNAIEVNYNNGKNQTYIYNGKGKLLHTIDKTVAPLLFTPDGTKAVLSLNKSASDLYYVNAHEVIQLKGILTFLNISDDGRYLFYTKTDSESNYSLRCYDTKKKKENIIASHHQQQSTTEKKYSYDYVVVSPDGKTYSFSKVCINLIASTSNSSTFDLEAYISINGKKPKSYGKNKLIFGISNEGKYVYYEKLYDTGLCIGFYVKAQNNEVELSDELNRPFFNKDFTEIMYTTKEGTYLCIKGNDIQKISDAQVKDIILPKLGIKNNYFGMYFGIETFLKKVVRCNDQSIYYIGKGYQAKMITTLDNVNSLYLSNNGAKLIYQNSSGPIIKISNIPGEYRKETISNEATSYVVSNDLNDIYYLNNLQELFYCKASNMPIKLTSGVTGLLLNPSGNIAFFMKESEAGTRMLYYSKNGSKPLPVKDSESVNEIITWNYGIVFKKNRNGKTDIYYNTSGAQFKRILKGVNENLQNEINTNAIGIS